jgi:hypothetical protein
VSRSGNETEGERRKPRNKTVRSEISDAAGVLRSHAGVHVVKATHVRESARGERRGLASARVGVARRAAIARSRRRVDRDRADGVRSSARVGSRGRGGARRETRARCRFGESEQITVFVFGRETHEGGDVEPGEVLGDPGLPLAGLGVEIRGLDETRDGEAPEDDDGEGGGDPLRTEGGGGASD